MTFLLERKGEERDSLESSLQKRKKREIFLGEDALTTGTGGGYFYYGEKRRIQTLIGGEFWLFQEKRGKRGKGGG